MWTLQLLLTIQLRLARVSVSWKTKTSHSEYGVPPRVSNSKVKKENLKFAVICGNER